MNIILQTKKTIERSSLLKTGDKVLIGVSGGPDSVCLLHILMALRHELGISLHIAHFDHGLRKTSSVDRRFVESLAKQLNIPYSSASKRIATKKTKGSLEEIAREARFDFLIKTAKKNKANVIALGHNRDDLAETVLMRILRGTGLSGLRAIMPLRRIKNTTFIRPLIDVTRKDIEQYLKKGGIRYRKDPTNKSEKFFRNKIRRDLLPVLEKKYNRNIRSVLANLAQAAADDYDLLDDLTGHLFSKMASTGHQRRSLELRTSQLTKLHLSLQRNLIRKCIEQYKGSTRTLTFSHILEIEDLLCNRPIGSVVNLPDNLTVLKGKGNLAFRTRRS